MSQVDQHFFLRSSWKDGFQCYHINPLSPKDIYIYLLARKVDPKVQIFDYFNIELKGFKLAYFFTRYLY